uniref:DNA-directed RNA polymerase n=1 Tax=Ascaris lumbricoides TaxID=6252 RepID=A0A0M3INS0_ASCLU
MRVCIYRLLCVHCSKEFDTVAKEFKRKFPQKAIPSGKDARLADILEKRLVEYCSKEFDTVAKEFKRKFPQKAIPSGKDARLADILEKRLVECSKKSESSFWIRVAELLSKIEISSREKAECYNGLVEERLACFNLVSFTCQFVQQQYQFRLVPAKIVIHEARIAEDSAQKCRKLVRLVKERRRPSS